MCVVLALLEVVALVVHHDVKQLVTGAGRSSRHHDACLVVCFRVMPVSSIFALTRRVSLAGLLCQFDEYPSQPEAASGIPNLNFY